MDVEMQFFFCADDEIEQADSPGHAATAHAPAVRRTSDHIARGIDGRPNAAGPRESGMVGSSRVASADRRIADKIGLLPSSRDPGVISKPTMQLQVRMAIYPSPNSPSVAWQWDCYSSS
jgi:hypothetical protein